MERIREAAPAQGTKCTIKRGQEGMTETLVNMNRRAFLKSAAGVTALASACRRRDRRPNVVFILTDDHRWDCLSVAGHPFLKTPNMDRIAKEGVRFANAFCTTSLCSPSRASSPRP